MELSYGVGRCLRLRRCITGRKAHISTSCTVSARQRKRLPKLVFPTRDAFLAHKRIKRTEAPEIYQAQVKRLQWDYPLGPDQRATWKHRLWFDEYLQKWFDTSPRPKKNEFSILSKTKRGLIAEQDNVEAKLHLLLDKDRRKKYIVPSLNMEFMRNASYFYQYLTNTKFVHGVPYNVHSTEIKEEFVEEFERYLTTILQLEYYYNPKTANEKSRKNRADRLLTGIVHRLLQMKASETEFRDCVLDQNPENSMFWHRGRGFYKYNQPPDLPVYFQSHDTPLYQIRTKHPLPVFTPWLEDFMLTGEIPHSDLPPYLYNLRRKMYRNTITPGYRFKAGDVLMNYQDAMEENKLLDLPPPSTDPCQHGHTQFISLPESFSREWYNANLEHCDITDQVEEHIKAHGIMSGWTWSAAQAHYKGHWMDHDIEDPISVQTVISDGQYFSFFCYQLNTVAIDPDNMEEGNQRRNVSFGTPFMKLYDRVEGTDDIQLYRDATLLLLKFISNSSRNTASYEETVEHNTNLQVQEWDAEKPAIEHQRPKHVVEKEAAVELVRLQEIEKNKGLKDRILEWVQT